MGDKVHIPLFVSLSEVDIQKSVQRRYFLNVGESLSGGRLEEFKRRWNVVNQPNLFLNT